MENLAVEVVALPVIAQIEPQHVESACKQLGTERDHVTGLSAAFPAVHQQRDPPPALLYLRQSQKSLQADTVAAIDQPFPSVRQQHRAAPASEPLHGRQVADRRLHLAIAQRARRRECRMRRQGTGRRHGSPPGSRAVTEPMCIDIGAWSTRFIPVSGGALVDANIRNPIPLSTQQTRLVILTLEIGSLPVQTDQVKVFKCVDVYDSVKSIINLTCDNRHGTTAFTNVKYRSLRSK